MLEDDRFAFKAGEGRIASQKSERDNLQGDQAVVVEALPRYYPKWLRWVIRVPGLRELLTWNLLLIMRRLGDDAKATGAQ